MINFNCRILIICFTIYPINVVFWLWLGLPRKELAKKFLALFEIHILHIEEYVQFISIYVFLNKSELFGNQIPHPSSHFTKKNLRAENRSRPAFAKCC